MKAIGWIVTYVLFAFLTWAWSGWVLVKLWHWFIAPQFGIRELSIPVAIGLSIIVGYLTKEFNAPDQEEKEKKPHIRFIEGISIGLMKPAFALFVGWVVHFFL